MPGSMTHKNRPSIDVIIWERFFCVCNIMRGVIFLLSGGGDRSGCTYVIGGEFSTVGTFWGVGGGWGGGGVIQWIVLPSPGALNVFQKII